MAHPLIEQFLKTAVGQGFNPDGVYGFQCKDLIDAECDDLFPRVGWEGSIRPGNAKVAFANSNNKYFKKVKYQPGMIPPRGAIIVWDGWGANPYGHIAIVNKATKSSILVTQQDGFTPRRPAHHYTFTYDWQNIIGWLIPRESMIVSKKKALVSKKRTTVAPANYRWAPKLSGKLIRTWPEGKELSFKGFTTGQKVNGSSIWFVEQFGGGFIHSSALVGGGNVKGLKKITRPRKPAFETAKPVKSSLNVPVGEIDDIVTPKDKPVKEIIKEEEMPEVLPPAPSTPGKRTSEFLLTVGGVIATFINGILDLGLSDTDVAGILGAIIAYITSRTVVKRKG